MSAVVTAIILLFQAYNQFQQGVQARDQALQAVERSYLDPAAAAVFFFETHQLTLIAEGLAQLPHIDAVAVYEHVLGEYQPLIETTDDPGGLEPFEFPLSYVHEGEARHIGRLIAYSDLGQLRAQVLENLRRTAGFYLLVLLAMAAFVWWLTNRSLRMSALERQLEDNTRLLSMAASVARVGGWEVDLEANRVYWSDEVCRLHDMPPGSTVAIEEGIRYYAPEHRERITEVFTACTRDGTPYDEELDILTASGRRVRVRTVGQPVHDDHGRVVRVVGAFSDITERRLAEQRLRASEATLRAVTEASPDPIVMTDDQGTLVYCNPAVETTLGYAPEALIGRDLHGVLAPEHHQDANERGCTASAQPGSGPVNGTRSERRALHKDGHEVLVELSSSSLQLDGRWHAVSVLRDISQRKQFEGQLALQARRAEALLELPGMAERLDEPGFMQWGQEIAEDLTGSRIAFIHFVHEDQDSIELITWSRRTLEDYCEVGELQKHYPMSAAGIWADAARTRRPLVVNDYASHPAQRGLPDGHAELRRLICVPVIEGGRVTMLAGVGNKAEAYTDTDVETVQLIADQIWSTVQRRRTETRVRQLSLAVEQSPESIVITNLAAEIEYVNESFLEASGYSWAEVEGANPRILRSGKTPKGRYEAMWGALTRGEAWQGEFHNRRKDGTEFIEYGSVAPLRQANGAITHYVAVKTDITEKQRTERELDRYRHRLEELVAQRTAELSDAREQAENANRAKSAFLANMSHEIRTPINAVAGLTHLLQRDDPTPEQLERLRRIESATGHLLSIVTDILDLAKIESDRLSIEERDFELTDVLDAVHSIVAEAARAKGLRLEVERGHVPRRLRGDAARLRQALLNLAWNAVKFTGEGYVHLRAELLSEDDGALLVRFGVEDSGIGIASERLPALFESFEQLDPTVTREYGGTGLGLAITRRLAELMGGEVGVESEPGRGSHIWFTARLRRAHDVVPMAETAPKHDADLTSTLAGARVLLAEDNEINREVAMEVLRGYGVDLLVAENGRVAVELARGETVDLVLMDVQMPELDGLSATREMRALPGYERVPILAMTANVFEDDRRACLEAGMDGFIGKPMAPPDLRRAIAEWLQRGRERRAGRQ